MLVFNTHWLSKKRNNSFLIQVFRNFLFLNCRTSVLLTSITSRKKQTVQWKPSWPSNQPMASGMAGHVTLAWESAISFRQWGKGYDLCKLEAYRLSNPSFRIQSPALKDKWIDHSRVSDLYRAPMSHGFGDDLRCTRESGPLTLIAVTCRIVWLQRSTVNRSNVVVTAKEIAVVFTHMQ